MCPLLKSRKEIVEVFELIPQERVKSGAVKQTDDQNTQQLQDNQLQVARQAARRGSERERKKKKGRKGQEERKEENKIGRDVVQKGWSKKVEKEVGES